MNWINAHVKICYLACAILSYLQYKLKLENITGRNALDQLQYVHKVELESIKDNLKWEKIITLKNEQLKILKAINCSV